MEKNKIQISNLISHVLLEETEAKLTVAIAVLQQDNEDKFRLHLDNGGHIQFEVKEKNFVETADLICDMIVDSFSKLEKDFGFSWLSQGVTVEVDKKLADRLLKKRGD